MFLINYFFTPIENNTNEILNFENDSGILKAAQTLSTTYAQCSLGTTEAAMINSFLRIINLQLGPPELPIFLTNSYKSGFPN